MRERLRSSVTRAMTRSIVAGDNVRFGIAPRLFLGFCGIAVIIVVVAFVGDRGLRDSRRTLLGAQQSFGRVSDLVNSSTISLDRLRGIATGTSSTLDTIIAAMDSMANRLSAMDTTELPVLLAVDTVRSALTTAAAAERTLLLPDLGADQAAAQRADAAAALERAEAALAGIADAGQRMAPDKRGAWNRFSGSWKQWTAAHRELMRTAPAPASALEAGRSALGAVNESLDAVVALIAGSARDLALDAAKTVSEATSDAFVAKGSLTGTGAEINSFKAQLDIISTEVRLTTQANTAAIESSAGARRLFVVCAVAGIVLSVILALWQTRSLSRPIRYAARQMRLFAKGRIDLDIMEGYAKRLDEIGTLARSIDAMLTAQREEVRVAGEMASGDFTGSVPLRSEEDRLGTALSEMMQLTRDALARVNRHVGQVTDGAQAISTVSQSLSASASKTAEELVEISGSTTRLGEQTHQNAANASQANDFAISSRRVAENGYAAVEEMVTSMEEIQASSAKIAQIVKLIDGIAFQTNLLALNAAVEAARAGRQGRGFSIVAEEVRNLASRSAKAARETAALVADTADRIANGAAIAMRTDEAFKTILESAQRTTDLYGEIAAASMEQSKDIDTIAAGLTRIDQLTRKNSHYAAATAESAQTLSRQANELRRMMVRFRLRGGEEPEYDEEGEEETDLEELL